MKRTNEMALVVVDAAQVRDVMALLLVGVRHRRWPPPGRPDGGARQAGRGRTGGRPHEEAAR